VTELTDSNGNVVKTYDYRGFGEIHAQTGTVVQPFAFTSRDYDSESGLYFYRGRYYDPKVGRFINRDPIGFAGGDVNLFRYVQNNSVNFIDPEGLSLPNQPPPRVMARDEVTQYLSAVKTFGIFSPDFTGIWAYKLRESAKSG